MTALSRQRAGKSRVGGRVIGLDLENATSRPLQFRPAALRLQRRPEIEVCTREIGVEVEGLLQHLFGFGRAILGEQHGAEGRMGTGRHRLQRERRAIRLLGLDVTTPFAQELAQVATRANVTGLQPYRLQERGLRFVVSLLPVERDAEATMERRMIGAMGQRQSVGGFRLAMATLAAEAQGEIRTHANVVRSQGQGLA